MAKKKRNWTEIGRVIAIVLEGLSGMIDRLCDRSERRTGVIPAATEEESTLAKSLTEEYNE